MHSILLIFVLLSQTALSHPSSKVYLKNAIPRPEFSLCFSRNNLSEKEGSGAGALTLGGVDSRLHTSPMVFAKNVKSSGFYAVHLKAMYLRKGGSGLNAQITKEDMRNMHSMGLSESQLNSGNVIVDSGTTDTYFTRKVAAPFKKAWKDITGKDYNHNPVMLSPEELEALPTIVLVMSGFEGDTVGDEPSGDPNNILGYVGDNTDLSSNPLDVVVTIPATHYYEFESDTNKYVPRFYTEEASGSVLGANAMMGYDVYFDVARGRIGFAESNCDYVSLVLSEGTSLSNLVPDTANTNKLVIEEENEDEPAAEKVVEVAILESKDSAGNDVANETTSETKNHDMLDLDQSEKEKKTKILDKAEPDQSIDKEAAGRTAVLESNDNEEDNIDDGNAAGTEIHGKPVLGESENYNEHSYGLFENDKLTQGKQHSSKPSFMKEILDDVKHECLSSGCRSVLAVMFLGALAVVIVLIRKAITTRRVVRDYHESELEISDMALDSYSDDVRGGYSDNPPMPEIS